VGIAKHIGKIQQLLEDQYADIAKHIREIQQLLQDQYADIAKHLGENPTTIIKPICEYCKYKMASCILDMKGCKHYKVGLMTMLIIQLGCKYSLEYLWVMCFLLQ
jgi:hypothetical protein